MAAKTEACSSVKIGGGVCSRWVTTGGLEDLRYFTFLFRGGKAEAITEPIGCK